MLGSGSVSAPLPLPEFLARFREPDIVEAASCALGWPSERVRHELDEWLNEAPVGLDAIASALRPGMRILEVGAATGVLGAWLASSGYDVSTIDPATGPHRFLATMRAIFEERTGWAFPRSLAIGAEDLASAGLGTFDLVFSIHVLEHVTDLEAALDGTLAVLRPGGSSRHLCPNYAVPYEPHTGVPVLHFAPGISRRLFHRRIEPQAELWDSVRFVTARQVRRYARQRDRSLEFEGGLLHSSLARLEEDPRFAGRHPGLRVLQRGLRRGGAMGGLRRLPATWATPMLFTLR